MRWLAVLILLPGCMIDFAESPVRSDTNFLQFYVQDMSYHLDAQDGVSMVLKADSAISAKRLKNHMLVLVDPTQETLSMSPPVAGVKFQLERREETFVVMIKPSVLKVAQTCGLYMRAEHEKIWRLVYTFFLKPPKPRLVSHDIGDGKEPMVSDKRYIFTLHFDQPMMVHDERAISLVNHTGAQAVVRFERVILSNDQKTITLRLPQQKNPLSAGQLYHIIFHQGLTNLYGDRVVADSVHFRVVKDTDRLLVTRPLMVSSSDRMVAMRWSLSQRHDAELYVAEHQAKFDCIEKPCPLREASIAAQNHRKPLLDNQGRFFLNGLRPETTYDWLMRASDKQGGIIINKGQFSTQKMHMLRFSEVMINPQTAKGEREEAGEYIELINSGAEAIRLAGLRLMMEDTMSHRQKDCDVVPQISSLELAVGEYLLIAGNGFKNHYYQLDEKGLLIRLPQKTLCGGLANGKEKIITIHWGDGHFIDRYGGFLWSTPAGQSVQRINVMGLDEAKNYCYSDIAGPTPGRVNGLCGK